MENFKRACFLANGKVIALLEVPTSKIYGKCITHFGAFPVAGLAECLD